jgi:hypothetical protein
VPGAGHGCLGWVGGLGCIVGQAVFQKREGLGTELADVCGEAGKLIVGQDATAYVIIERALDSHQRVRCHLRAEIVGGSAGLGGQQRGEGVRVVGDRLLLAREQCGAGSDHTVDRPQPCESLKVTGFDLVPLENRVG